MLDEEHYDYCLSLDTYRKSFNLFNKESKRLDELLPPRHISQEELLTWFKVPENFLILHNQMELVKHTYSELRQAWQDLQSERQKQGYNHR